MFGIAQKVFPESESDCSLHVWSHFSLKIKPNAEKFTKMTYLTSSMKRKLNDFVFVLQSAVMSTCFAKFHPNLVVGGTYSGQIVLWDNRANKRTPVQRTPLSAAAHTVSVKGYSPVEVEKSMCFMILKYGSLLLNWHMCHIPKTNAP